MQLLTWLLFQKWFRTRAVLLDLPPNSLKIFMLPHAFYLNSPVCSAIPDNRAVNDVERKVIFYVPLFFFSALSVTERELFRELIRQLDRKINPGLGRLTWNSEYMDAYIEDCFNQTANVGTPSSISHEPFNNSGFIFK